MKRFLLLLLCLSLLLSLPVFADVPKEYSSGALCGMALHPAGGILVADTYNKVIWRVAGDQVSLFAGEIPVEDLSGEPQGRVFDGPQELAGFASPWTIVHWNGGWAVSDAGTVRLIRNGSVNTISASFRLATGMAVDDRGTLYVAETEEGCIRTLTPFGALETYARDLTEPMGLCWHDGALYVAETGKNRVLRITEGETEVLCGLAIEAEDPEVYYGGYVDGPAETAELDHPQGLTVGEDGAVYIADTGNGAVRVLRDGRVDTLARRGSDRLLPAAPRGLVLRDGELSVSDAVSGGILTLSVTPLMFRDVSSEDWFAEAVTAASARGLAEGVSLGIGWSFLPNETVTRAMFVTFLSRLYQVRDGNAIIDGDEDFSDVKAGAWYAAAARWGKSSGLVNGVSEGVFAPESPVTREQIAAFLFRLAGELDLDRSAAGRLSAFLDGDAAGTWARPALRWAVGAGLLRGTGPEAGSAVGRLLPNADATRAETAALLIRFMDYYGL